jgi:hypothetical protein
MASVKTSAWQWIVNEIDDLLRTPGANANVLDTQQNTIIKKFFTDMYNVSVGTGDNLMWIAFYSNASTRLKQYMTKGTELMKVGAKNWMYSMLLTWRGWYQFTKQVIAPNAEAALEFFTQKYTYQSDVKVKTPAEALTLGINPETGGMYKVGDVIAGKHRGQPILFNGVPQYKYSTFVDGNQNKLEAWQMINFDDPDEKQGFIFSCVAPFLFDATQLNKIEQDVIKKRKQAGPEMEKVINVIQRRDRVFHGDGFDEAMGDQEILPVYGTIQKNKKKK